MKQINDKTMEKPIGPNPFDEPKPESYELQVRADLITEFGFDYIRDDLKKEIMQAFGLNKERVIISEIRWVVDHQTEILVLLGPYTTSRSVGDIEKRLQVRLTTYCETVNSVKRVDCLDIIP